MSDDVINIEEIIAYSLDTFPGLIEDWNWGERSLFYNPERHLPKGTYFLTFKERDGANDTASRIRPGDYRLNVGISKAAFTERFGALPARPAAGGMVQTGHDFSQRDRILPHPVYGWMCWIAIVNPTHEYFEEVKPLLKGAYERAVRGIVAGGGSVDKDRIAQSVLCPSRQAKHVRPSLFAVQQPLDKARSVGSATIP